MQAERKRAEDELRRRRPTPALTEDDIRTLVESLVDLVGLLEAAEPQKKAALYESLGLSLTYEPRRLRVLVEVDLSGVRPVRVGGPTSTIDKLTATTIVGRGGLEPPTDGL